MRAKLQKPRKSTPGENRHDNPTINNRGGFTARGNGNGHGSGFGNYQRGGRGARPNYPQQRRVIRTIRPWPSEQSGSEKRLDVNSVSLPNSPFGGKYCEIRLILDLTELNKLLVLQHFKLENFDTALQMVSRGDFMTTIDLQDAYFSVKIHVDFRKFLKFRWG